MSKQTSAFKIALYIRVSTEEQAENPEGSIRNQEERLRQAVEYKNKIGQFGEIKGVYVDAGISAKNMKRPKLQEMLKAIREKEIDLVMVTELSRLSRSTRDFIQMWDLMRDLGCRFTSLREDFDTTNAAGEMVLFQMMNLAQFERRQTSERVAANLQARASRGLYNGGPVPIGFKVNPERAGYLEVDTEMAIVVQAAFDAYLKEGTLLRAVAKLNDQGYRMKKAIEGGGSTARTGRFTFDNLQAILRHKAYIGVRVYKVKGEVRETKAVWDGIINEAVFQRVNEMLSKNKSVLKTWNDRRVHPYILTGVTSCQVCRSRMSGKSATGNGGKVGYYEHCWATKRDAGLSKKIFKCEPQRVPAAKLEPIVWEKFQKFITDKDFMLKLFEEVKAKHEGDPTIKERERLKSKLSGLNWQIEALAERLSELPKDVPATPIYNQMAKLNGLKKDHEVALENLQTGSAALKGGVASLATFEAFVEQYRKLIERKLDPDQRKKALQKFVRLVAVGVDSVKIHFIVDEDYYKQELALETRGSAPRGRPFESKIKTFNSEGSSSLTNGASGRNRTGTPV